MAYENLLSKGAVAAGGVHSLGTLTVDGATTLTGAVSLTAGITPVSEARTAVADPGGGTGVISAGTDHVVVTSANAAHVITLPAPVVGKVVTIVNGATGYELRSSDPATIAINGGTGAGAESAIGANVVVVCRCVSATRWICSNYATAGTESATEAAA